MEYLGEEYLRDTQHLTDNLPQLNQTSDYNLFSLDVVQLYPSINPDLCKLVIGHALDNTMCLDVSLKTAITEMLDLILDLPYISNTKRRTTETQLVYLQGGAPLDRRPTSLCTGYSPNMSFPILTTGKS